MAYRSPVFDSNNPLQPSDTPIRTRFYPLDDEAETASSFRTSEQGDDEEDDEEGDDLVQDNNQYDLFADSLQRVECETDGDSTVESAPCLYADNCDILLSNIEQQYEMLKVGDGPRIRRLWEAERNTWRLINNLKFLRDHPIDIPDGKEPLPPNEASAALLSSLAHENHQVAEAYLVREWLQAMAPEFEPVETAFGYRLKTLERSSIVSNVVGRLDPDAPAREGKRLHADDEIYEQELVKSLYEYIRRGHFTKAYDMCRKSGHMWRAASLGGHSLYGYSDLDFPSHDNRSEDDDDIFSHEIDEIEIGGNANRSLWRSVHYQIAQDERQSKHDKALSAALCGDVDNVLPLCTTWEDYMWAYYNAYVEYHLELFFRKNIDDDTADGKPQGALPADFENLMPEDIFARIDNAFQHGSARYKRDRDQAVFHEIQKYFILNRENEVIALLEDELKRSESLQDPLFHGHLLRFLTHYLLYLVGVNIALPDDLVDVVVRSYTDLLLQNSKEDLIALYASKLRADEAVDCYASFLSKFGHDLDRASRLKFLKHADSVGISMVDVITTTAKKLFEQSKYEEQFPEIDKMRFIALEERLSDKELRRLSAIVWLSTEKSLLSEACRFANAMCRQALAYGRVNVVKHVFDHLADNQMLQSYIPSLTTTRDMMFGESDDEEHQRTIEDAVVEEHRAYQALLEFFMTHEKWHDLWRKRPRPGEPQQEEYDMWPEEIKARTKDLVKLYDAVMEGELRTFSSGKARSEQMVTGPDPDLDRISEMECLQRVYMPEVVIRTYRVLLDTSDHVDGNLEKITEIIHSLADSSRDLYYRFAEAKKMKLLLGMVRESSLDLLEKKKNAFA